MSEIENARDYLAAKITELRAVHGVPAMSAVLVRDGGDVVVAGASGLRKWDAGQEDSANQVQLTDKFNVGSVSKPFTGYLIAFLVETGVLNWDDTIADVFPELTAAGFRSHYGSRSGYLGKTVEQLMTHNAGMPYGPSNGYDVRFGNFTGEFVNEYCTVESEVLRRYNYVLTALQDAPVAMPGTDIIYGGGSIICAAMAERRTQTSYNALMKKHVFDALGMSQSGFGRLATSAMPDGVWQHSHNPANGSMTPDTWTTTKTWGYHSHGPAGAVHTTAEDMAKFIRANLPQSGKPKVVLTDAALVTSQEQPDPAESGFSRAGWAVHDSGDSRYLEHNGDNGRSYAWLRIRPPRNCGFAAMTNVGGDYDSSIGSVAVVELIGTLEHMQNNWSTLF
jgi:CubicO group peptidase (beta-lactamase class C family)